MQKCCGTNREEFSRELGIRKECQGEREKGRGGAKTLKVRGVKAAAQKWRGKGIGGKGKKEREFMYTSLCVPVKERVNRLFVIKRLVYFLGA